MSLPEANRPAGSGIGGRVTTIDLKKGAAPEPESLKESLYEEVPLSNIRKLIARTMQQSLSNAAQLTLNTSFDASEILRFRKAIKEKGQQLKIENITLNDMILYSVSRVLADYGELNAHLVDDRIRYFKDVHLGVAVDTNRGLMVPTIFHANRKSLNEISREAKHLAEECRRGTVNPDFLKGGSFTVTNLGSFGIESFTPILNPPQVGILGVNTVVQRIREVDGKYEYYPSMGLSLTFDHRALDGGPAARFLMDLVKFLENFSLMLAM